MAKLGLGDKSTYFTIDGIPYQRGAFGIVKTQSDPVKVGLNYLQQRGNVVEPIPVSEWIKEPAKKDAEPEAYETLEALIGDLQKALFK